MFVSLNHNFANVKEIVTVIPLGVLQGWLKLLKEEPPASRDLISSDWLQRAYSTQYLKLSQYGI